MRVIVLRAWPYDRTLVVVVILIANIPIEPLVQLDREPRFRRLKTHRIRRDQRARIARRISDSISLTVIFIDPIGGEQGHSRSDTGYRLNEEKVISDKVEAIAQWMLNVIEEIVELRIAVNPMVVVAGADRETRGGGPIE